MAQVIVFQELKSFLRISIRTWLINQNPCETSHFLAIGVLTQRCSTSMTLTPGIRTHLGNDWYFLAGLPTPVTKDRVAEIGMIFGFMKAW